MSIVQVTAVQGQVPKLVGESRESAVAQLKAAGLVPGTVTTEISSSLQGPMKNDNDSDKISIGIIKGHTPPPSRIALTILPKILPWQADWQHLISE